MYHGWRWDLNWIRDMVQIGKILHKAFLLSNERHKRIVHEVAPREIIRLANYTNLEYRRHVAYRESI